MHPELKRLVDLRANITPGVWGPTTSPAEGERLGIDASKYHYVKEGERGPGRWGAVVSDAEPREVDHERYATPWWENMYEPGTDIYGGTMVCESLQKGNGEYIAAVVNAAPGMMQTIRDLRAMVVSVGVHPNIVDEVIAESMKGEDPVGPA